MSIQILGSDKMEFVECYLNSDIYVGAYLVRAGTRVLVLADKGIPWDQQPDLCFFYREGNGCRMYWFLVASDVTPLRDKKETIISGDKSPLDKVITGLTTPKPDVVKVPLQSVHENNLNTSSVYIPQSVDADAIAQAVIDKLNQQNYVRPY